MGSLNEARLFSRLNINKPMTWDKLQEQGKLYGKKRQIHFDPNSQKRLAGYKVRMKRRPTRGEKRFWVILKKTLKTEYSWLKAKKQRMFFAVKTKSDQKGYIADFYLPKIKLVIEIDGSSHDNKHNRTYDMVRSSYLASRGIKVLRFTNDETKDSCGCRQRLFFELQKRINLLRTRHNVPAPTKLPASREDELAMQERFAVDQGVTKCPTIKSKRRF